MDFFIGAKRFELKLLTGAWYNNKKACQEVYLLHSRLCLIIIFMLLYPLVVLADGCAFGDGFSPQLRETNQLAVINLTESTADVSMFISIEGIPAGKEITYILPFWYQPDGFSLTEEDASSFRNTCVAPAHKQIMRMQRIAARHGSNSLLEVAPFVSVGLPSLMITALLNDQHRKWSMSTGSAYSTTLTPYATNETPHARAELYRIGENDLQQLIQQSGLPAKYLEPLKKYRTPYFAVMRLKGLAIAKNESKEISGRGIRYHFTHRITGGRYKYPLGTGAAWPQPIPLTEVYITCPEGLAMRIKAPVEGEQLDWRRFYNQAGAITYYVANASEFQINTNDLSMKYFLAPKTTSLLDVNLTRTSAWHIAYSQSNPAEDISVRLSTQFPPWRFEIAEFFALPGVPFTVCIILYLLAWFATTRLVIRRRWQYGGTPGNLLIHGLRIFFIAQCIVGMVSIIVCGIILAIFSWDPQENLSDAWKTLPLAIVVVGSLTIVVLVIILFTQLIVVSRRMITSAIIYVQKTPTDWHKGLTLAYWICPWLLYAIIVAIQYQNLQQTMNAALLTFPLPIVVAGSLITALLSIVLFALLIVLTRRLITALISYIPQTPTDWRKGLTLTCWLCSSLLFVIMAAMFYGFLYWCETI